MMNLRKKQAKEKLIYFVLNKNYTTIKKKTRMWINNNNDNRKINTKNFEQRKANVRNKIRE
jgi:hypothetical protein